MRPKVDGRMLVEAGNCARGWACFELGVHRCDEYWLRRLVEGEDLAAVFADVEGEEEPHVEGVFQRALALERLQDLRSVRWVCGRLVDGLQGEERWLFAYFFYWMFCGFLWGYWWLRLSAGR
jgi:hypothetical protein